jgi:hypothetical protein
MQSNTMKEPVQRIIIPTDIQENQEPDRETPADEIQDVYLLIVRERIEEREPVRIIESTPARTHRTSCLPAYMFCGLYMLCILSCIAFQVSVILNPLIATVTIVPKSQTVTLTGTMQLGRQLQPLTISQSLIVPTTGRGYQPAEQARGSITLYNGQFQNVTIAAGTIFTEANGIQVVTDQDATISAGNPPSYGQVTVSAHAISPGSKGNIPAYDINQTCCALSVLAKNVQPFTGGQDARTYTTVTQNDIHSVSTVLKTTLAQSITGALQGQLQSGEVLRLLPCSPTVTSDHQPGQEATQVKVTVSQTCSAVSYNSQELVTKATDLLSHQATTKLATGYSLLGAVKVSVTQATIQKQVILSCHAQGTWIYGISQKAQQQIKHLIAGKTTQQAETLLASLPGVEQASIRFTGFGDNTRLPKNAGYIHLSIFVV